MSEKVQLTILVMITGPQATYVLKMLEIYVDDYFQIVQSKYPVFRRPTVLQQNCPAQNPQRVSTAHCFRAHWCKPFVSEEVESRRGIV